MQEMIRRCDAAHAAVVRFDGRPLVWGREDCARLAAFVMRRLGHKPSLAKAGSYSSATGALRALRRLGYETLADAVDAQGLLRIPPAMARPADIIGLTPEEAGPWCALTVALGNGRVLGFQGGQARILQPNQPALSSAIAWRL